MSTQSILFTAEFQGIPRYELNTNFYDWGIITNIVEFSPLKSGEAFNYGYTINNMRYGELMLLHHEIKNSLVRFDSLDKTLQILYAINYPKN